MDFSENGVEAARHELLVDGGLVSNAGLYNQDLNVNIYSEMVFHIRKFLRMGVKFVDASSKICLREAVVGAVAVEAVLSASGARLTGIARAALSTRAAREFDADSGTGTAQTEAAKTRAVTEASERKSIVKMRKECRCRLDECECGSSEVDEGKKTSSSICFPDLRAHIYT